MLARGLEPRRMFAEILGRGGGYCGGKGGSMHVSSFRRGRGRRERHRRRRDRPRGRPRIRRAGRSGRGSVAVAFFGDGAANQGVLFESLNLAALWQAPVLFVCENNGYTEFTPDGCSHRR